jgi:hypothetical protein
MIGSVFKAYFANRPGHLSTSALGSAAGASGMVRTKTTVLLTVDGRMRLFPKRWPIGHREPKSRRSARGTCSAFRKKVVAEPPFSV